MTYIDGFVAAVPTANCDKFKKHAEELPARRDPTRRLGEAGPANCPGQRM